MCWSKSVSGITFILAISGSLYLFWRNCPNDRWIAIFTATIAMIQLAEYFMWSYPSCTSKINTYAAVFAIVILMMEPFMNIIGGLCFSPDSDKKSLILMLISYIIFVFIIYLTQFKGKDTNWCATSVNCSSNVLNPKSCNLQWKFMDNISGLSLIIWVIFLIVPFLLMKPFKTGLILFLYGLLSLFVANVFNNAAVGSLWCWFAIFVIGLKIFIL